jgi:hypothetical protein
MKKELSILCRNPQSREEIAHANPEMDSPSCRILFPLVIVRAAVPVAEDGLDAVQIQ